MLSGEMHIWIYDEKASIPIQAEAWAESMHHMLEHEGLIKLTVTSTDRADQAAVGFSPDADKLGFDLQAELSKQACFGFYVTRKEALEISGLFKLIADSMSSE